MTHLFRTALQFLIISWFISCSTSQDKIKEGQEKTLYLKSLVIGNSNHIDISPQEVEYLSGIALDELSERTCQNVFCDTCNNVNATLEPFDYYLNLGMIGITFLGTCIVCQDTLMSSFAIHKNTDRIENFLVNKHLDKGLIENYDKP